MNLPNVCMLSSLRSSSSDLNGSGASRSSSSLSVPHLYLTSPLNKPKENKFFFIISNNGQDFCCCCCFRCCLYFSSPRCFSVYRFCCSVAVCNTVPATTLSSRAAKVMFGPFVILTFPGSVTRKHRLLTRPSDSTREFGVEKMQSRGTFWYVCIVVHVAGQYLVHGCPWAAKSIVIFNFRDFCGGESSDFWVGFLHFNLLILRVLHTYIENKRLPIISKLN